MRQPWPKNILEWLRAKARQPLRRLRRRAAGENSGDSHEFQPLLAEIEDEPLNPLGRTIFWIIISVLVFTCGWMFFGKVDVVVTARGKVIPEGEVKVLQPLTTGVVAAILVREGELVRKGQVLMEIDPSTTEPELTSMRLNHRQLELELLRLEAVLAGTSFEPDQDRFNPSLIAVQRNIYQATMARLQKQRQVKEEELQQVDEQLAGVRVEREHLDYSVNLSRERLARLDKVRDIISRQEYEKAAADTREIASRLAAVDHRIKELLAARKRIASEMAGLREEERDRLLEEMAKKRKEYLSLKAQIDKITYINARQQLLAPVDGYVNKLMVHTVGGVVSPAEKLLSIVPASSPLVIKTLVLNQDIGFVEKNMAATIKVDTFSFQKYGTLRGIVKQVGRDSLEDKRLGLVYQVYVTPLDTSLLVEGAYTPITTGMSVTAEIKVGKRRIIEFFIYPIIKYLDEGISVR